MAKLGHQALTYPLPASSSLFCVQAWNDVFFVTVPNGAKLRLDMFDHDMLGSHDFLGRVEVSYDGLEKRLFKLNK